MTDNDLILLRQFTRDHSQDAFTEIVRRHLNLVYSAALRQVRSPQLAEEVAQSVFTDLARNAGKLKPDTVLVAWLHAVTRRTAVDVIRKESRRQLREQIAMEMNVTNAAEAAWPEIEPLLDEAVAALDETDRAAVLLRYFENKSLRDVGQQLGVSDDTAQKRVSRAVERLREFFAKRGIAVGAGGLTILISANAVQSAPVGLTVTISTVALAGTAAISTSTAIATTKIIAMTTLQKTIVTITVAALVGAGVYEAKQAANARAKIQILQQQQTPLAEQIRQLQSERDMASNQVVGLTGELVSAKRNNGELLKLRGEVKRLRNELAQAAPIRSEQELKDVSRGATNTYINTIPLNARVRNIELYLLDHPEESIPEIQFASVVKWLNSIQNPVNDDEQVRHALELLRQQAMVSFMTHIKVAEEEFEKANDGRFPTGLTELLPYLDTGKGQVLLDNYEITPAKTITDPNAKISGDWVIVRKTRVNPASIAAMNRQAVYRGGQITWYASDARD